MESLGEVGQFIWDTLLCDRSLTEQYFDSLQNNFGRITENLVSKITQLYRNCIRLSRDQVSKFFVSFYKTWEGVSSKTIQTYCTCILKEGALVQILDLTLFLDSFMDNLSNSFSLVLIYLLLKLESKNFYLPVDQVAQILGDPNQHTVTQIILIV